MNFENDKRVPEVKKPYIRVLLTVILVLLIFAFLFANYMKGFTSLNWGEYWFKNRS